MKNRRKWRALWAALVCVALLGGAFAASAEEAGLPAGDVAIADAAGDGVAVEDALELDVPEEAPDLVDGLPELELNGELTLDMETAEPAQALELADETLANEEAGGADETPSEAVPLTVSYTGDPLIKVYDCNSYAVYKKDGQLVYVIPELKTIQGKFRLSPAEGQSWVEGHEGATFKVALTKQFDSADVGSYAITFRITLTGESASYYTLPEALVTVPASITPREVVVTPRAGLSKTYGSADPVYPSGSWLNKDETSPLHQDVGGVPGYGIPVNSVDGKLKLSVDDGKNGAYILNDAKNHGTKFFHNDGWLSREPGEDAGKYRITLGKLDFGDNFTIRLQEEYFTINPRDINDSGVTVKPIPEKTYTGKAIQHTLVIRFGGRTLKSGRDFNASFSANKRPGTAKVTIAGRGNFTGTRRLTFKIVLKPTTIAKLTPGKGQVVVRWKRGSKVTGYQVAISRLASFVGQTLKDVPGLKKTAVVFKGLLSNKYYYVRVRTTRTFGGTTYYSAWSKAKRVRTK